MDEIILIGSGGHARSCIDVIEAESRFKIAGLIDNQSKTSNLNGYPIIGNDKDLSRLSKHYKFAFIAIGQIKSTQVRINLFNTLKDLGYILPTIISPLAYVSNHSKIDEGTIIMHNAIVNSFVNIGKNNIINSKALVEHDVQVGNHCHISTGAIVNGNCIIKNKVFIGSGTICKHSITIKDNVIINAGKFIESNIGSDSFLK